MGIRRLALGRRDGGLRLAAIFPGQGSQRVGMGGEALGRPDVRALFERAERVLGYDLERIVREGPEETLRETRFAQPAIYVVNYALAVAAGVAPEVVASAGHSFAELCSLVLADAFDFETALVLVRERGLAMQAAAELAPGAMSAILGLDAAAVRDVVARAGSAGRVQLANFNAPTQIVVSGDRGAVAEAGRLAVAAGARKVAPLSVSGAWHSALMDSARERYAPFVAAAPVAMPRFDVVSNVDAAVYADVETIRRNLVRSVTDEVRWHEAAERLVALGVDRVVEFGGSAVLAPLVKRLPNAPPATHVGDERGLDAFAQLERAAP